MRHYEPAGPERWDPAPVLVLGQAPGRVRRPLTSAVSAPSIKTVAAGPILRARFSQTVASAAPQGAAGMHGWAPDVIGAVGEPETNPQGYLQVFFAPTDTSREADQQVAARVFGRSTNRDEPTTWQTRQAQYDAVCAWGIPIHSLLQRVAAIELPVFVAKR